MRIHALIKSQFVWFYLQFQLLVVLNLETSGVHDKKRRRIDFTEPMWDIISLYRDTINLLALFFTDGNRYLILSNISQTPPKISPYIIYCKISILRRVFHYYILFLNSVISLVMFDKGVFTYPYLLFLLFWG